jgi:hypothetical protein
METNKNFSSLENSIFASCLIPKCNYQKYCGAGRLGHCTVNDEKNCFPIPLTHNKHLDKTEICPITAKLGYPSICSCNIVPIKIFLAKHGLRCCSQSKCFTEFLPTEIREKISSYKDDHIGIRKKKITKDFIYQFGKEFLDAAIKAQKN